MRRTIDTTMRRLGMKNVVLLVFGLMTASIAIAGCTELTGPKSPETPINVTATLLSGTSVRVQWDASPQSDGVISYNIIRNGTKVGETTGTSLTETGLPELTKFEYSVSANCTSGVLSDASPVTAASTVTTLDVTPPRVTNNQPPNGFNGVSPGATMTATFSEAMDIATINTTNFTVRVTSSGALVTGTVTYTAATRVAEFTPASPLASSTNYTATVTTGAKDTHGNGLTANFSWAFTTADVGRPFVTANNPANGATGVSPTAPNISVTFNEPMEPTTINSQAFTVQRTSSGALVTGTVAYTAATRTATFTPSSPLLSGVEYTVTMAATVRDLAGNSMGTPFQFSFTTVDANPPTLTSTTPVNLATGVAANSVITAVFSEAMNGTTINATTFTLKVAATSAAVAGTVTYNVATFTATFTPTAPLAASTAYIATVTAGAKDLAGNALAASVTPNPWTFTTASAPTVISTTPANLAPNVPTNTVLTATFSEAMDATTLNATTFTLRVTATSAPVTGTVAYNAGTNTATFTPSVPLTATTAYTATITTGARNAGGTALAGPFSWAFSTVDNVPPTVTVSPLNGATNVPTGSAVGLTFSEVMDATTINGTTITLKNTATSAAVAGVVSYVAGTTVGTFTPNVPLAQGTGYTVTVTTGVKDVAGNAMAAQFTSTFTTLPAPDNTAPTVTSISPANGSTTAPPNTAVYVTFSEPMDATTITGTTITLRVTSPSSAVGGTVTYNAGMNMAIFTPTSALTASTGYTVTVTTGVKDVAGNALASPFTSTFTTTAGADATAPTVTNVTPANNAIGVSVSSAVTVAFSEGMDPTTISGTTFTLKVTVGSAAVAGTVGYNSTTNVATFTPTAGLTAGTGYTVTITTGVKDLAQNAIAAQFTSAFTTAP